jgi:hypothetical protein
MLQNIDKNWINPLRAATVFFVLIVLVIVLFDFLAFSTKDDGLKTKLGTDNIKIERINGDSLYISLPFIVENNLATSVSSRSFIVKFAGKDVTPVENSFSLSSGEKDTLYISLMFNLSDSTSTEADSTLLEVSFDAGLLYRSWSGKYSGNLSASSLIKEVLEDVKQRIITDEKMVQGFYTENGSTINSVVKIVNSFPYPIETGFVRKPVLGTGGNRGAKSASNLESKIINPGDTTKFPLVFTIEPVKEKVDNKEKKHYKIDGFLSVKVFNLSDTVKVSIVLTGQPK